MNDSPAAPRPERPVLVWIICLFYFVTIGLSLLALILVPLVAVLYTPSFPSPPSHGPFLTSKTWLEFVLGLPMSLIILTGAIYLFLLRRPALYLLLAGFVLGLGLTIYNITAMGALASGGAMGLIGLLLAYALKIAILIYVWHLFRKGLLR